MVGIYGERVRPGRRSSSLALGPTPLVTNDWAHGIGENRAHNRRPTGRGDIPARPLARAGVVLGTLEVANGLLGAQRYSARDESIERGGEVPPSGIQRGLERARPQVPGLSVGHNAEREEHFRLPTAITGPNTEVDHHGLHLVEVVSRARAGCRRSVRALIPRCAGKIIGDYGLEHAIAGEHPRQVRVPRGSHVRAERVQVRNRGR